MKKEERVSKEDMFNEIKHLKLRVDVLTLKLENMKYFIKVIGTECQRFEMDIDVLDNEANKIKGETSFFIE